MEGGAQGDAPASPRGRRESSRPHAKQRHYIFRSDLLGRIQFSIGKANPKAKKRNKVLPKEANWDSRFEVGVADFGLHRCQKGFFDKPLVPVDKWTQQRQVSSPTVAVQSCGSPFHLAANLQVPGDIAGATFMLSYHATPRSYHVPHRCPFAQISESRCTRRGRCSQLALRGAGAAGPDQGQMPHPRAARTQQH